MGERRMKKRIVKITYAGAWWVLHFGDGTNLHIWGAIVAGDGRFAEFKEMQARVDAGEDVFWG